MLFALLVLAVAALVSSVPVPTQDFCARFPVGSEFVSTAGVQSTNHTLNISLTYRHKKDSVGRDLFCYNSVEFGDSPVIRLNRGDTLNLALINGIRASSDLPMVLVNFTSPTCLSNVLVPTGVNIHFHGLGISPNCTMDNVVATLINSDETLRYSFKIPLDTPSGLFAYHHHIHGFTEMALQGGASGVFIVSGIEMQFPQVAGLPEQILQIRDNLVAPALVAKLPEQKEPGYDISLNFIPIPFPDFKAPYLRILPGQKQFWRVVNLCSDTTLLLRLLYDGVPQELEVVALDGVGLGSQEGDGTVASKMVKSAILAPFNRVEFIMTGPSSNVKHAVLVTDKVNTGADGDNDPARPILTLKPDFHAPKPKHFMPAYSQNSGHYQRFHNLSNAVPTVNRKLYFSEVLSDPTNPESPTDFYVTVDGQTPRLYTSDIEPAIVTVQGTIEDWVVQNHALEEHVFHIHQVHFLVIARNGVILPTSQQQYLDTVLVPAWTGDVFDPYPSVTIRFDFRGPIVGTFVFHCHILGHEDAGMMQKIQILPEPTQAPTSPTSNTTTTTTTTSATTTTSLPNSTTTAS